MIDKQRDTMDGLRNDEDRGPMRRIPLSAAEAARWGAPG